MRVSLSFTGYDAHKDRKDQRSVEINTNADYVDLIITEPSLVNGSRSATFLPSQAIAIGYALIAAGKALEAQ